MSLPKQYSERLRKAIGARAVWMPGTPVQIGSIMIPGEDKFNLAGHLSDFTPVMKSAAHLDKSLDLVSKGTRQRLFQAGVELPSTAQLDLTAEATLKFEFSKQFEYALKAPTLKGQHITNLLKVADAVYRLPDWQHKRFYIVHELYEADQFTFLGTEKSNRKFEFSGKGAGILGLLTAGVSAGLSATGDVDVKILGKGGPLAMGLVRIKENGKTDYVP
jgi:hypothetical protein